MNQDFHPSEVQKDGEVQKQVKARLAHLVLQACTQDEVIVGHSPASRHTDAFGLPLDAHHLPGHRGDTDVQLGQVSAAVCMAAESSAHFLSR